MREKQHEIRKKTKNKTKQNYREFPFTPPGLSRLPKEPKWNNNNRYSYSIFVCVLRFEMMINQKGVETSSESHTHKKTGVLKYPVSQDFFLSLSPSRYKNDFQLLLLLCCWCLFLDLTDVYANVSATHKLTRFYQIFNNNLNTKKTGFHLLCVGFGYWICQNNL